MSFIELKRTNGVRFLFDADSGWEIDDHGPDKPAWWGNGTLGMNMNCADSYEAIRARLLEPNVVMQTVQQHDYEMLCKYAGMAVQGMLASQAENYHYGSPEVLSKYAVKQAASLIAELKKVKP